jgi:hypothetical protein
MFTERRARLVHLPALWAFLANMPIISLLRLIALKYCVYSLVNSAVQTFGAINVRQMYL